MGFIKRFLGLEQEPGEPVKLSDSRFEETISASKLPCIVYFYHLWCNSCQVMGGLLNEIGPEYKERARFYKMDIMKEPHTAERFEIKSVPRIICFKDGEPAGSLSRLIPLDELKEWIETEL